ncbi:hypothetical protein M422DRAFT_267835 [Sphaerobolus stellatus SS14]|uniref:Uncharacterized protein n=1 Tax=Sphaerobolus stellatus (strain SS14) TaxID=990650 RepID=A0A0C9UNX4_SPHS4|nr:hypothetical protein M422DRAFT_267835 [Sphaerobolus stellatus SS14]
MVHRICQNTALGAHVRIRKPLEVQSPKTHHEHVWWVWHGENPPTRSSVGIPTEKLDEYYWWRARKDAQKSQDKTSSVRASLFPVRRKGLKWELCMKGLLPLREASSLA